MPSPFVWACTCLGSLLGGLGLVASSVLPSSSPQYMYSFSSHGLAWVWPFDLVRALTNPMLSLCRELSLGILFTVGTHLSHTGLMQ